MTVLPRGLNRLRIASQGLVPATQCASVEEAAHRMLALQGQQVSSIPHVLVSRTRGAVASDVRRAFDEGALVRSWPMRGTVHVTTADDHHWMRAALLHRYGAWKTASIEAGMTQSLIDEAGSCALELIGSKGPLTRSELVDAWEERGLMRSRPVSPTGSAMSDSFAASWWKRHLVMMLHFNGILAQGPMGAGEHLIIDATRLPSADSGPAGARVERGESAHRQALAEIARRYASGHGPVSAHDLARWTGLSAADSVRALEDALEETSSARFSEDATSARHRLMRIRVVRGRAGGWAEEAHGQRRADPDVFYLRADIADIAAENSRQIARTLFLASFDELHVGYKDRSCLTDEAGERLICPAKNGMFRPIVVDGARVVAVRPAAEGLVYLSDRPSAALQRRVEHEVARTLARLSE